MNLKKEIVAFLIFLILFGIFMGIMSLGKEYAAEEVDYIKCAIAIANTGHPLFYQFEQKSYYELGLWHPPMYVYSLSLIAKFSTSEIALRSLNYLFTILTALIIFLFCIRSNKEDGKQIGLLAVAIFLINYYVFSSSTLMDIDVLSMFFVFLFFYLILSYYKTKNILYGILASLAFLLSLANRYPIIILTFLSIAIYFFIKKETKKFVLNYFIVGIIGGVLFLDIWSFYSTIIEPGTFFAFIEHNSSLGAAQFSSISLYVASFFLNIAQIVRLFTLPAVVLFALSNFYFFKRKEEYIKIILIYCWTIFLFFLVVPRPAFGYPRYFLTMMPGFAILIAIFIYENLKKANPDLRKVIFTGLIFLLSLNLLIVMNPHPTIYRSNGLILATNLPDFIFNILCLTPIFLVLFLKKEERKLFWIMALIGALLAYSFYFDIKTTVNNSHIKDVAEYLKQNSNGEIIMAPKEVGYYYGSRFYANDFYKPPLEKTSVKFITNYIFESFSNPNMTNQFFWGDDIYGGTIYFGDVKPNEGMYKSKYIAVNYLRSDKKPEKIIGDWFIYRMKD